MFGLTHKSLAAYESSPAQGVDEVSTNNVSASLPSFFHFAEKNREPTHTSTNYCSLKNHYILWITTVSIQ